MTREVSAGILRPVRRQRNQPRSADAESRHGFGTGPRELVSARPSVSSHGRSFLQRPSTPTFPLRPLRQGINFTSPESAGWFVSPPSSGTPGMMPVQTKSRNQSGPTSDPFDDPNAIRVVPPPPPKVPSKRDTGMDTKKDASNTRNQDSQRAKPIRSQTQQNVGSVALVHPSS